MRSEMEAKGDYKWTEEDFKRASAPTRMDFVRFNAMWQFDRNGGSQWISREDFADALYETARDVGVPEKLNKICQIININRKKIEKSKKKEKKKKTMLKKKKKKKKIEKTKKKEKKTKEKTKEKKKMMLKKGYYDEKEEDNKEKLEKKEQNMMLKGYDPEDPKVQAEMDDKFKDFERRLMFLQVIHKHLGPAAADAAAIAALEAEDPLASLAQAAAKALPPNC